VLSPPLLLPIARSSPAFFGADAVLVGPHDRAVDHRIFVVRIGRQKREDTVPDTAFGPSAPTPMRVVPVAEALGKIAPGDPGSVAVDHRVDEAAVIGRRDPHGSGSSWQNVLDQVPLVVTELVGAHVVSLRWN